MQNLSVSPQFLVRPGRSADGALTTNSLQLALQLDQAGASAARSVALAANLARTLGELACPAVAELYTLEKRLAARFPEFGAAVGALTPQKRRVLVSVLAALNAVRDTGRPQRLRLPGGMVLLQPA